VDQDQKPPEKRGNLSAPARRADHQTLRRDPPTSWQARQPHPDTLAALDRLLDTHTDAQTAEALNADGRHSGEGKPFTAGIVVHPPQVPSP